MIDVHNRMIKNYQTIDHHLSVSAIKLLKKSAVLKVCHFWTACISVLLCRVLLLLYFKMKKKFYINFPFQIFNLSFSSSSHLLFFTFVKYLVTFSVLGTSDRVPCLQSSFKQFVVRHLFYLNNTFCKVVKTTQNWWYFYKYHMQS